MDDTTSCPICSNKMRTTRLPNKYLHAIDKTANYFERSCTKGINHTLQLFTNESTKKVDLLRLSLNHKYSRFLEIDYINQKCRIFCFKNGEVEYIKVDKMIEPDFPNLSKLKEKVSLYIIFS